MILDRSERLARKDLRARNAFRLMVVVFVAMLIAVVAHATLIVQIGAWQLYAVEGIMVAAWIGSGISLVLIRQGRVYPGITVFAGLMIVLLPIVSLFTSGVGLSAGVGIAIGIGLIVLQTLPARSATRFLAAAVVAGALSALLDIFGSQDRVALSQLQTWLPAITVAALAALGLHVARRFYTFGLRTKLLIGFIAISLLVTFLFAFIADRALTEVLTDRVGTTIQTAADSAGRAIGDRLAREVNLLEGLGLNKVIQEGTERKNDAYTGDAAAAAELQQLDREWRGAVAVDDSNAPIIFDHLNNEIASELRRYQRRFSENAVVMVTDRYGGLVAATERPPFFAQTDQAWWRAAWNDGQGAIYIGAPWRDESSQVFASTIAVPLYAPDTTRVIGVLCTSLAFSKVQELLASGDLGATGAAVIVFPDRTTVTAASVGAPMPSSQFAALQTWSEAYREVEFAGTPSLVGQAHVASSADDSFVRNLDWRVVTHQDLVESLEPIARQNRYIVLFGFAIVGLAAGSAAFVSQRLSAPIVRLTRVAEQVAFGDLGVRAPVETLDEVGALATTFNSVTAQVRNLIATLEQSVARRTEQLRASADVGRAAASILDPDHLLREVVNLITNRFGFYYAAVFLIDESGKEAVLRAATGEAGRVLLERRHSLAVGGQSMVGYVTVYRTPRIALDVGDDPVRFANPYLPETRSEIALPLVVGDRVLGALDVQSTESGAFDEASASVLQSMADQIAIALNNATSYADAQSESSRTRALYLASQQVSRLEVDVSTVVEAMMRAAGETLAFDHWWVILLDEQRQHFTTLTSTRTAQRRPVRVTDHVNNPIVRAALEGDARLVNDPEHDLRIQNTPDEERLVLKFISVPIASRGLSIGALTFGRSVDAPDLTARDLEIGKSLASLIAVALENRNLLTQTRQALAELDALNRRLTGETWQAFTRQTSRDGIVWVGQSENGDRAESPEVVEAMSRGKITVRPLEDDVVGVAVPIILRSSTVGVLRLTLPAHEWDADTAAMLESIASHVAQAAENARLVQSAEERAGLEHALAESSDKVRRKTEMDSILQTAAEELARKLSLFRVSVRVGADQRSDAPLHPNGEDSTIEGALQSAPEVRRTR